MGLNRPVNLYLDQESRYLLEAEARDQGVSLSAWLRALARWFKVPATMYTPLSDLKAQFRSILAEELAKRP